MKKIIIYIIIVSVTVAIAFCVNKVINSDTKEESKEIIIAEKVTDECTEEYEEMNKEISKLASSSNEKISPNAKMILKKYYTKCNHTIEEEIELPEELVNKNISEVKEEYSDWEIEEFSEEKVVLIKNYEEQCGQHYVLRDNDGIIAVYQINSEGKETLLDETEIATEYLAESDLVNIKEGIKVNGIEELNKLLEDFE